MKLNQPKILAASDFISRDCIDVIIAYENRAAGERAMQVFTNLVAEFGDELQFQAHLWRFDILALPLCRKFSELKGDRAHLLIVSTSSCEDLPQAFRDWFSAFLATPRAGGIVALFGGEDHVEDKNSKRLKFLREAAHKTGFEFFEPYGWQSAARSSLTYFHNRSESTNHAIVPLLHPESHNRGWGINE